MAQVLRAMPMTLWATVCGYGRLLRFVLGVIWCYVILELVDAGIRAVRR